MFVVILLLLGLAPPDSDFTLVFIVDYVSSHVCYQICRCYHDMLYYLCLLYYYVYSNMHGHRDVGLWLVVCMHVCICCSVRSCYAHTVHNNEIQ